MRYRKILLIILGIIICSAIHGIMTSYSVYNLIASIIWLIISVTIAGALIIVPLDRNTKCPVCNRRFALRKAGDKEIRQENISIKMPLETRNRNGDIISTSEQYVPGKRIFYQRTFVCKYCGKNSYSTYSRDRASV